MQVYSNLENIRIERLLDDPFYKDCLTHYQSIPLAIQAGFFDDGQEIGFSYVTKREPQSLYTTPFDKIDLGKLEQSNKPLVLLTTGSFAPIHTGHLSMMEAAKDAASSAGYDVVGGYISVSHDEYVHTKTDQLTGSERVHLCQYAVNESDWLMVDPFEAMYVDRAINFTDVILHLKEQLSTHLGYDVEVAYVYGEDNAAFSYAFVNQGVGICVRREGVEGNVEIYQDEALMSSGRILFSDSNSSHSSTQVRQGKLDLLDDVVKEKYVQLLSQIDCDEQSFGTLFLRNEGVEHYAALGNKDLITGPLNKFTNSLCDLFLGNSSFNEVYVGSAVDQKKRLSKTLNGKRSLSLDDVIEGDISLKMSRKFSLANGQVHGEGFVSRPGEANLEDQIASFLPGEYVLFDDDIATGSTVRHAQNILGEEYSICDTIALTDLLIDKESISDVVDLRDFIVGFGGLVVELGDGSYARAPYVLPYVFASTRASVDPSKTMEFSLALWKMNYELYNELDQDILLEDVDEASASLFTSLGFDLKMTMKELCQWHVQALSIR